MQKKPIIVVQNVKKSYKKVEVLQDVSFSVEQGSIFALLGANGAGKTTTINILTTLLKADSGSAFVNGYGVSKEPAQIRQSISLTGQFAAVDDVLTGRENLELICDLRHANNPQQLVSRLLKQFDLEEAAGRYVLTYSGGMRRRLDIAMSLIGNPSIIFFDEPTTGLDPQSRNNMWQTIRELAASGTTIFLTTQYLEEADQLADNIAILDKGKIVAEGTPTQLKQLLPHGQVKLTFTSQNQFDNAVSLLNEYEKSTDSEALSIVVTTNGSVAEMTKVLTSLEKAGVEVAEFSQKAPTLDDAFFKIINDHKENV